MLGVNRDPRSRESLQETQLNAKIAIATGELVMQPAKTAVLLRFRTEWRLASKSFSRNATRTESEEGRLFSQATGDDTGDGGEVTSRRMFVQHRWPVSIKYGLRTTDYGLGIKHGLRYKTRTKARLHSMSKRTSPLLVVVTLKASVIYTQCALVHTRVRLLHRVRILYPVRNA